MRPFFHPSIQDVTVEGILHALADPVRASIFAGVAARERAESCSMFASMGEQSIPKSTLSEHFRILREAGLVRSERHGVEMHNTARAAEIEQRFPGLMTAIMQAYASQSKQKKGTLKKRPLTSASSS